MKKFRARKMILLWTAVLALAVCSLAGCGGTPVMRAAVSYRATESTVYSTAAEVVKQVADTVVEIRTESVTTRFGMQYIVSGAGSGVLVGRADDDYLIVTNNHVIDGANEITVRTRSGSAFTATLVATDDAADIAVITVSSGEELALAVWGNSDELQIAEDVIAIGNPLGNLGGTVTKGILSATGRTITVGDYDMTLLQTDAAINPGNSGGGLFNMRGQLIGIVNAKTSEEGIEGLCFAIPGNTAMRVYGDLTSYGYVVGRATLRLTLAEATLSGSGSSSQTVAYVSSVEAGADGNFRRYDRLSKINGAEITSILDYNRAMASVRPGDEVAVEVYRGSLVQSIWGSTISFETSPSAFTVTAAQYGI